MRQQRVRKQDRLCCLEVGLARHDRVWVGFRLCDDRVDQIADIECDTPQGIAQPHPEHGRNLVVAGTSSTQATTDLGPDTVDESTLHRTMDILIGRQRTERAVGYVAAKLV